jgi:uncharacterized protein YdhG (YjbR/CyaY superfamily)
MINHAFKRIIYVLIHDAMRKNHSTVQSAEFAVSERASEQYKYGYVSLVQEFF